MPRMIFVNLPVSDLGRAISFYEAMGATLNPKFTDDTAACMVFSETIHVMLLTEAKFRTFTPKAVAEARSSTEVLVCLSVDSRQMVDDTLAATAAAGGRADPGPRQDYGFMYMRSVEDPDGHIWEILWMDPAAAEAGCPEATHA